MRVGIRGVDLDRRGEQVDRLAQRLVDRLGVGFAECRQRQRPSAVRQRLDVVGLVHQHLLVQRRCGGRLLRLHRTGLCEHELAFVGRIAGDLLAGQPLRRRGAQRPPHDTDQQDDERTGSDAAGPVDRRARRQCSPPLLDRTQRRSSADGVAVAQLVVVDVVDVAGLELALEIGQ